MPAGSPGMNADRLTCLAFGVRVILIDDQNTRQRSSSSVCASCLRRWATWISAHDAGRLQIEQDHVLHRANMFRIQLESEIGFLIELPSHADVVKHAGFLCLLARYLRQLVVKTRVLRRKSHGPLGELVWLVQIAPQLLYPRLHGRASALEVTILDGVLNRIGGLSKRQAHSSAIFMEVLTLRPRGSCELLREIPSTASDANPCCAEQQDTNREHRPGARLRRGE
jgi:hypothetical protein